MQIPLSVWITWMPSKIKAVLDIPDFLSTSNTAPSCVLSLIEQFARIVFVRCFLPHTLLPEVLLPLLNQNYAYYYSFPLKKAGQPTELSWRTFCHSLFLCPVYLLFKIPAFHCHCRYRYRGGRSYGFPRPPQFICGAGFPSA